MNPSHSIQFHLHLEENEHTLRARSFAWNGCLERFHLDCQVYLVLVLIRGTDHVSIHVKPNEAILVSPFYVFFRPSCGILLSQTNGRLYHFRGCQRGGEERFGDGMHWNKVAQWPHMCGTCQIQKKNGGPTFWMATLSFWLTVQWCCFSLLI